jgi:hypothetical protein
VELGGGAPPPSGSLPVPPWQFGLRAAMVIAGLTLLLIVNVHGFVFYVAWSLIVLALLSEAAATLVQWQRGRA